MIVNEPPPMPLCFATKRTWQEWLMLLYTSGVRITRRKDVGKYSGIRQVADVFVEIDHCVDCNAQHQQAMQAVSRCRPFEMPADKIRVPEVEL